MSMANRRPRRGVKLAVEHLRDEMIGNVAQIVVRRVLFQGLHRDVSLQLPLLDRQAMASNDRQSCRKSTATRFTQVKRNPCLLDAAFAAQNRAAIRAPCSVNARYLLRLPRPLFKVANCDLKTLAATSLITVSRSRVARSR